jgi:rare lipoprotein A (peptidoglycan hydrolase)
MQVGRDSPPRRLALLTLLAAPALLAATALLGCGSAAPPTDSPAASPGAPSAASQGSRRADPSVAPGAAPRRADPSVAPSAAPRRGATVPAGAAGASAQRANPGASVPAHGTPPPAHPVPASFRIAPGAPSDAQVAREVAEMERIQHSQQAALSAAAGNIYQLLPWADEPKSGVHASVASVFRDYGLGIACGGVLGVSQLGVAHKTAPCGTLITFRYAGRVLRVPVIDRGPYIVGREWDLTGAAADALGFPGLGQIEWSLRRLKGARVKPAPSAQLPLGEQPGTPQTLPAGGGTGG